MSETCIFESYNIIDALKMVRDTLGPDAKIITTKKIKPFLGFGKEKIQIIAQKKQNDLNILNELQQKIENLAKSIEELREKSILKDNILKFIKKNISADFAYELAMLCGDIKRVFEYFDKNFKEPEQLEEKPCIVIGPNSSGKTSFIKTFLKKIKKEKSCYLETNKLNKLKNIENGFSIIEFSISTKTDVKEFLNFYKQNSKSFNLFICFEASKCSIAKEWSKELSTLNECIKVITKIDEVNSKLIIFDTAKKLPGYLYGFTQKKAGSINVIEFEKNKYIDYFINEIYENDEEQ